MASRQEEKERRRREREEAERAAQRSEARRKRIGMVVGGVLVAALIAVGVLVLAGGGDGSGGGDSQASAAPTFGEEDLEAAAEAAGCELRSHQDRGSEHTSEDVEYETNPPTSGPHDPVAAEDGVYSAGPPDVEQTVHALEHGRINFQYAPGAPGARVDQLRGMVEEEVKGTSGYHSLLFENQTDMDAAVAATAWVTGEPQSIACGEWNDQVFDALRAFRLEYVDKAPEFIP